MVVKLDRIIICRLHVFESRVILDGSQTTFYVDCNRIVFESRVILDGSQTKSARGGLLVNV